MIASVSMVPIPKGVRKAYLLKLVACISVTALCSSMLLEKVSAAQERPQSQAHATSIVDMGELSAERLGQSLGIGLGPNGLQQEWQFAAAKELGASWVRIQCGWEGVERQTSAPLNQPASPRYVQTPGCVSALTFAARYGLHVTEVAAYGPPFHTLLLATLPEGVAAGQSSLQITFSQGVHGTTLATMRPIFDYICPAFLNDYGAVGDTYRCQGSIGSHGGPPGTLITSIRQIDTTHATLALASATSKAIPANPHSPASCSMQAGSNVLTCSDGAFDSSWGGGLQVVVPGAGSRGALSTITTAVPSAKQLTLRVNASKSVTNVAISANRVYAIGEILYPSTGTDNPDDPSVSAYVDYVSFLASDMAARGVSGDIEIWNEPPWRNDSWDYRMGLYDTSSSGAFKPTASYEKGAVTSFNGVLFTSQTDHNQGNEPGRSSRFWSAGITSTVFPGEPLFGANYGFAANLQHRHFPKDVTATWNGTSGSGNGSLLSPQMKAFSGEALTEPSKVLTRESFHPYGGPANNPEDVIMRPDCLLAAAETSASIFRAGQDCYLPGERKAANLMQAVEFDFIAKLQNPAYGIGHSVTETNGTTPRPGLQMEQARFDLRQFLGLTAASVSPVEFFQMWDGSHRDPTYSFVDYDGATMKPLAPFTALSGLMSDLRSIRYPAQSATDVASLRVSAYSGVYPLEVVHVHGARRPSSDTTEMLMMWQLSAAPFFTGTITGSTLQVTAISSGQNVLAPGDLVEGRGVASGTTILKLLTGTGGVGTYQLSNGNMNIPSEGMNVNWMTLPSPAPGTASVTIPPHYKVTGALNLVTRKAVPYRVTGREVVLAVQDDPIEVVADPL